MRRFVSHEGVADGYDIYDGSDAMTAAWQISRYMPFKQANMAHQTMIKSAQNQSGQQYENIHAGVKTAHKSDNYGKM
jgi:hypothetical protein